jgi:hypothetical protein
MMNDEMEQFERRLQNRPLKEIPGEWRAEILANCRGSRVEDREPEASWQSTFIARLSAIFWPHPKAWAGLAVVWVCIVMLNFSTHEKPHRVAEKIATAPQPEMVAELKQQRLMFAELLGATELRVADRPKSYLPKPQGKRMEVFTV